MSALLEAGRRPRKPRVRRDPIDVEQLAAEFASVPRRTEQELVAALEAEVQRANQARAHAAASAVTEAPTAPLATPMPPRVVRPPAPAVVATDIGSAKQVGLPLDQVRAWLEQVKEDLRKVQARLQYLEFEHTRLQDQHHLVAELISSSTPV